MSYTVTVTVTDITCAALAPFVHTIPLLASVCSPVLVPIAMGYRDCTADTHACMYWDSTAPTDGLRRYLDASTPSAP